MHADEYEPEELLKLLPDGPFQMATKLLTRISEITEDKQMYDAREKAIRDRQWALNASREEGMAKGKIEGKIEGEIKGEIKLIRTLEEILDQPLSEETKLAGKSLEELQLLTSELQSKLRHRK